MRLKIRWMIPEGWRKERYCIVDESGTVLCHRDRFPDAWEMLKRLESAHSLGLIG